MGVVNPGSRGPSSSGRSSFSLPTVLTRAGFAAAWVAAVLSLFSALDVYPPLALIPIAFGIVAIVMQTALSSDRRSSGWAQAAVVALLVLAASIPFLAQRAPLPFVTAGAWALSGAYTLALAAGVWRQLSVFFKIAAVLFGLALVSVTAVLTKDALAGEPASRDDRDPEWSVAVTVFGTPYQFNTTDATPLARTLVNCAVVDFAARENVRPLTLGMPRITDDAGRATFGFKGPRWTKAVVCEAERKSEGDSRAYGPGVSTAWVPFFGTPVAVKVYLAEAIEEP